LYADQLTAVKAEEEARIDQKSEPYFAELRGKLLTLDELKSQVKPILTSLQRIRSVLHSGGPGSRDHDLVFNGVWLPNETEFTAGVGYSSDKGVGGKIGLTSRNLPLVKNSLLDLGIEAGTEKQDGHLSYTLPDYYKSADGRLSFQLDLTAGYKRDRDQKLGAPDSAGVREGRATGALKNVLRFTANPAATGGASPGQPATFGYGATLETTLGYSNTQLRTSEKDPALQDGSVFFALADLQQRGWRDLRKPEAPGIGRVEMSWQLRGKKGFTAGLGDFDFFTAETKIALTIYFGHESSRDFFVRVLVGGAISRGNTPIFEEFRLGGDTIVRGLEEGERLAREVAYDSMEAGVRAGRVWQWVSRTRDNKPAVSEPASSTSSPTPSVGGFDLGNSYISLFFDHAYIARPSSGSGADGLSRNLESVGAALEIPLPTSAVQGRLRIGYAWSPQSIHEQGRSFASVTLDFP
jgi:outer membrane protein assembly factor BamA